MLRSPARIALVVLLAAAALVAAGCTGSRRMEPGDATAPAARDTLALPGLAAPVRLITDRHGIPHLHARSLEDLYLAWGFVTARDRLWQMEHSRRGAQGRLSEWFGNRALRADGGAQLFELAARARRIWSRDSLVPEARVPLERFAAGVNAYLALCRSGARPWPEELRLLGREPEPWRPADSVLLLLGQGVLLDLTLPELDEIEELERHGPEGVAARHRFEDRWVYRTIPDGAAGAPSRVAGSPSSAARTGVPPALAADARRTLAGWLVRSSRDEDARASNVFAVGPRRAAGGKPILANDPHLPLTAPGALYVVHVTVPGAVDAIGATVAGLPSIVSGRNRDCAWGITSLAADVIDVYADTLSADGKRVRWNGGWAPLNEQPFTMRYRLPGGLRVPVLGQVRRYTPHGPVLSIDKRRRIALSARWAGRDQDVTLSRLLGLERSRDASEVAERARSLVTPGLNVVAADVQGRVVYQTVGAVPRRPFAERFGLLPGDGTHEWSGLVPPDSMPAWSAPPAGFVVNGNNLPAGTVLGERWPRFDWPHDRAHRMAALLEADASVTLEDARRIQNDRFSRGAERFVPMLLGAAEPLADRLSPRARAALDTLRGWDSVAERERVAPVIYRSWYAALQRRLGLEGLPGLTAAFLSGQAPEVLATANDSLSTTPAEAAVAALESALVEVQRLLGPDLAEWRWGRAHRARFRHALAWRDSTLSPPPQPADGDNSTPCVGASHLPSSVIYGHAPIFRHLVDLAVADSSLGVVAPGNSGERASGHARDQLQLWADHGYVPFHLDWGRIEALAESELLLVP